MICPNCQANNENLNVFCIVCGTMLQNTGQMIGDTKSPTLSFQNQSNEIPTVFAQSNPNIPPTQVYGNPNQSQNSFAANNQPISMQNFAPFNVPNAATLQNAGSGKKTALIALLVFFGLAAFGAGGYFLLTKTSVKSETLPTHLGMFVQSSDKDKVDEIKKKDFANAIVGKDELLKDDALPGAEGNPNLLLYSDSKEISLNDLRLIQLDTIKPDGTLKQLDFQAAPVDGKPDIKRIRIPDGLANGKYAFAILDGDLDDGKHKFWAFQVKNSEKANNDSVLKTTTLTLKPKEQKNDTKTQTTQTTQPTQTTQTRSNVVPPSVGAVAYSTSDHLILRDSPSLTTYTDTGIRLRKNQRVYVQSLSSHSDTWKGRTGRWAYITTEDGTSGWVFSPLLRY